MMVHKAGGGEQEQRSVFGLVPPTTLLTWGPLHGGPYRSGNGVRKGQVSLCAVEAFGGGYPSRRRCRKFYVPAPSNQNRQFLEGAFLEASEPSTVDDVKSWLNASCAHSFAI